ncbi:ubiquinol-cytochrome C chaperone family protein [Hansschlegelia sp. KR7-227]|uniref:ubiquinol-cytochrome C chaperone family protein n=1 Tax=Hansschlegelia sp. KR7-227 TaxID=3400914 RepID=UPI003BFBFA93
MIFDLLRRRAPPAPGPAETAHAAIVEQARRPFLYRELGAPDTLPGRFEVLVLHAALYLRRLRSEGSDAQGLGQEVFDALFRALDANLREIGIGDLTVPKKMNTMVRSFYDGAATYDSALDAGDGAALEEALARIVYGGAPADPGAPARLAAYVRRAEAALAAQPPSELLTRGPRFPDEERPS